jgi:glycosyltransferase involved in cell wall biosynthesis
MNADPHKPKISVLMPAYNCENYIAKAITSILNQTYSNFDLLICDDGSTDNTGNIIKSFTDPRIKKFTNEKNKGYLKTYNYLLSLATGELVAFQDADDWSSNTRLQEQLEIFNMHDDIYLTACNGGFYYSEKSKVLCPDFTTGVIILNEGNFDFMLPSIMLKRDVLKVVNGQHSYFDNLTGMDQYFIMEILSHFKGYAINRHLYFAHFNPRSNHRTLNYIRKATIPHAYYLLKKQRISTGTDWLKEGKENLLLEYEESLLSNRKFMAEKYREYAAYRIDSKQPKAAWQLLAKALSLKPFYFKTYRTFFYWIKALLVK